MDKINGLFDVVILDTPPNLSLTTLNSIQSSDLLLVVIDSSAFSLDGIAPLLEAAEEIQGEGYTFKVLRNKRDMRSKIMNEFIDDELEAISNNVLHTIIKNHEAINQAHAVQLPVSAYQKGSLAVNNYNSLAKEIKELLEL